MGGETIVRHPRLLVLHIEHWQAPMFASSLRLRWLPLSGHEPIR